MIDKKLRTPIAALTISGLGFISILGYEGYTSMAIQPVEGDVWTYGFGTTGGVKEGDTIEPMAAIQRAYSDVDAVQKRVKSCITAELSQGEFDAFCSLAYNIGTAAFCSSTLVKKVNGGDHAGARKELLRWVYFKGKKLNGLVNRRESEYKQCMGY